MTAARRWGYKYISIYLSLFLPLSGRKNQIRVRYFPQYSLMLTRIVCHGRKIGKSHQLVENIWASFHLNLHIHNQYHSIMLLVGAKQLSAWPANFRHTEHAAWLLSHTVQLQAPGTWTHGLQTIGLCLHPRCPASCSRAPSRYQHIKEQHFPYLSNICTLSF